MAIDYYRFAGNRQPFGFAVGTLVGTEAAGGSACYWLGPISGSHQGQQPQRLHRAGETSKRQQAGYMAAPERFVKALSVAGLASALEGRRAGPPALRVERLRRVEVITSSNLRRVG
jgi:hypothetical protein